MSDVTWVVTCMDPRKLRLLLRWLPVEPWPWLHELTVITHRDRPDLQRAVYDIVMDHAHEWPVYVRTDDVEERALLAIDAPEPLRAYFRDSLGVKLLLPLTIHSPLLFTDDDVIVTQNPHELLGRRPFGSHSGLDGYTETAKDLAAFDALCTTFDLRCPLSEFNPARTDAGVWYLPHVDLIDYIYRLRTYFSHPHTAGVSLDTGTAPHGHTQRFRKLDQRFLSGYMVAHDGLRLSSYRALAERNPPKSVPGATFVHYCASGRKDVYMDWLEGVLDGR